MIPQSDGFYWIRTEQGLAEFDSHAGRVWEVVRVIEGDVYLTGNDCSLWAPQLREILEWRRIDPPTD